MDGKGKGGLTLGSLFDGSGGFPLAGIINGIRPLWASEVEPFPIRVTEVRIPSMRHLGDIAQIRGGEVPPVDIITFGSPCQDLSIAGRRAGLDGGRSGLFFEAVRVIREMREATDGRCPRFVVWENVPGAFTSAGGEDFRTVVEELLECGGWQVPVPAPRRWGNAGLVLGDGISLAWRVLDAQYWGVPQRRKRIFLVVDLDGGSAGEVLFDSEGVPGDNPQDLGEGEGPSGCAEDGTGRPGGKGICLNDMGGRKISLAYGLVPTLRAQAEHPPLVFQNHSNDSRYSGPLSIADTVTRSYGSGGNNQPLVATPKTMRIRSGKEEGGGKGALVQDDLAATLSTHGTDQTLFQPRAFHLQPKDSGSMRSADPHKGVVETDVSTTLDTRGANPGCDQGGVAVVGKAYALSKNSYFTRPSEEVACALVATDCKDPQIVGRSGYLVRRLTPTECARLQGFPDWWCDGLEDDDPSDDEMAFWRHVFAQHAALTGVKCRTDRQIRKWLAAPRSDSAEYRMWGNGVALPCVSYVLGAIAGVVEKEGGHEEDPCCGGGEEGSSRQAVRSDF